MAQEVLTPIDWLAALGWAFIGFLLVKSLIYPHGSTTFDYKKWVRENIIDLIRGLLVTLVFLQLGSSLIVVIKLWTGFDLTDIDDTLQKLSLNSVQLALVVSVLFQLWLYKRQKSKKAGLIDDILDNDN